MKSLIEAFRENNGEIKPVLRTLFNSDFFRNAQFKKVKNPAELVAGTIKLVGTYDLLPAPGQSVGALSGATTVMGQSLMNPPTVEGWHTGHEWIDGGTLNERVNFAVNQFNDLSAPGVQDIISRLSEGGTLSPDQLVDRCLDLVGPLEVGEDTRTALSAYADSVGDVDLGSDEARTENAGKVARMLQLIVASREYQFA